MRSLALAVASVWIGGLAAADPVFGTWKTEPGDDGAYAHIEISGCDGRICGILSEAFDSAGAPVQSAKVGKRMIWDMSADGIGGYSGGKIWAPDRDKTYKSRMALGGDTLEVSGCVGPFCRGQTWVRVK